jgi:hypothetical protein
VAAVALDKGIASFRGERQRVEWMLIPVVIEEIGGPAVAVCSSSQILALLDGRPCKRTEVARALSLGQSGQPRAWVGEVGEDVVDNLDGQCLEAAP